jgi:hypothetical protein
MSIGRPVSGDTAWVGGAGTATGVRFGATGGAAIVDGVTVFGLALVVTVVDVAAGRVVVVVSFGFGRVVVVVDVVVVGAGLIVSTRKRSVPQALPATRRQATRTLLRRVMGVTDRSGRTAETGGYASTRPPPP